MYKLVAKKIPQTGIGAPTYEVQLVSKNTNKVIMSESAYACTKRDALAMVYFRIRAKYGDLYDIDA